MMICLACTMRFILPGCQQGPALHHQLRAAFDFCHSLAAANLHTPTLHAIGWQPALLKQCCSSASAAGSIPHALHSDFQQQQLSKTHQQTSLAGCSSTSFSNTAAVDAGAQGGVVQQEPADHQRQAQHQNSFRQATNHAADKLKPPAGLTGAAQRLRQLARQAGNVRPQHGHQRRQRHQRQQRHQQQCEQQQETLGFGPSQVIAFHLARAAASRVHSQERRQHLQDALQHLLQWKHAVHPGMVSKLLHHYEEAGQPLPWPAMQQLLQHLAQPTSPQHGMALVLRALRSASHAKLCATQQPAGSASSSCSNSVSTSQHLPAVDVLLQQLLQATKGPKPLLEVSSIPSLLRCISVLNHPVPQHMLEGFVHYWVQGSRTTTTSSASKGSSSSVYGREHGQHVEQAATIIKAVTCMEQQLPAPLMQQVLQPLMSATSCSYYPRAAAASGVAAVVDVASWLPQTLVAAHAPRAGTTEQQRAQLLQLASDTLIQLAASASAPADASAAASAASSAAAAAGTRVAAAAGSSRSASLLPATLSHSIWQLLRSLATVQRASPVTRVPGLADQLASALLAANATTSQLAGYLVSLSALNQAPSPETVAAITAAVVDSLKDDGHQRAQHSDHYQQLQQPHHHHHHQQQKKKLSSVDVSRFLWACASMGYSLSLKQQVLLLQHQVTALQTSLGGSSATFRAAQTLWGLANMGSPEQEHMQQEQQHMPAVEQLQQQLEAAAHVLLEAALQQQLAAAASSSGQQTEQANPQGCPTGMAPAAPTAAATTTSSTNTSEEVDVLNTFLNLPAPEEGYGVAGNVSWQLSLAAWAAAMCDLAQSKGTVLQLCSLLAPAPMWSSLRVSELNQLQAVHLWLCGDYQWSHTAGLAAVFSPQQMQRIRAAKELQTRQLAAATGGHQAQQFRQQQQQQDVGAASGQLLEGDLLSPQPAVAAYPNNNSSSSSSSSSNSQLQQKHRRSRQQQLEASSYKGMAATAKAGVILGPSNMQVAVCKLVGALPEIASVELEAPTPDGMATVDIHAVTSSGQHLAIEFDGPYHFARVVEAPGDDGNVGNNHVVATQLGEPSSTKSAPLQQQQQGPKQQYGEERGRAAVALATPGVLVSGSFQQLVTVRQTRFRDKVLRACGYKVVCVPFYDWVGLPSRQHQRQYLSQLLHQCLKNP